MKKNKPIKNNYIPRVMFIEFVDGSKKEIEFFSMQVKKGAIYLVGCDLIGYSIALKFVKFYDVKTKEEMEKNLKCQN